MKKAFSRRISSFEYRIKRKELISSYDIVKATLQLIVRSFHGLHNKDEIFHALNSTLEELEGRFPNEYIIQNICIRVRKHLDSELKKSSKQGESFLPKRESSIPDLHHSHSSFQMASFKSIMDLFLFDENSDSFLEEEDEGKHSQGIDYKVNVDEIFSGLINSLEDSYIAISKQANNFLCQGDIILTLGYSKAVLNFLSNTDFNLTVLLPERAPDYDGFKMAQHLQERNIKVIVIQDSAIFALLPRVQKIIIPARFVLANGGIISYSLAAPIALTAKHHSTPFIVLYWEMKLTGTMPSPNTSFSGLESPNGLYSGNPDLNSPVLLNPSGDYVPPELITLMIGPSGAHSPSDVFFLAQKDNDSECE